MLVTKISMFSGAENTMDLPITQEQLSLWKSKNLLVQDVFPNLTPDQREFLMTGITPQEWDQMFSSTEEE